MATKNYTKQFVNHNYLIKVFGYDQQGKKINKLVGCAGVIALIGEELFEKCINRAERERADKVVCKFRRGIQVTLYAH